MKKAISFLLLLLTVTTGFSQNLGNPAVIGQTNRNQKVGKGFQIEDTLLAKGKIRYSSLPASGSGDTVLAVMNTSGYFSKINKSSFLSSIILENSLFPNGISEEPVSRMLTSDDIGKLLIIVNDGVILTPEADMVESGDLPKGFGIWCLNPTTKTSGFKVNIPSEICYLESQTAFDGATGIGEIVSFITLYDDELETSNMYPITDIMLSNEFTGTVGQLAIPYLLEKLNEEKIIDLGTITYQDVNEADTLNEVLIQVGSFSAIPANYYIDVLFIDLTETFGNYMTDSIILLDSPSTFQSENILQNILYDQGKVIIKNKSVITIPQPQLEKTLFIKFFFSGPNPQNFTKGAMNIKALIKEFPN